MNRRSLIRTAGVAGAATAALGAAATSAQAEPAVNMVGATTPQDFGAVGDGVADDTAAIQRAIDAQKTKTNKVVYFPPGTYRITRSLVIPDREGLEANNFNRLVLVGAGVMASRTSTIQVAFAGTAIRCGAPLAAFQGLAFVSGTGPTNTVAIHTMRDAKPANVEEGGTDDMDTLITECTFIDFGTAVKHVGRGLVFINNLCAVGETGLDISWPTTGVKGEGVHLLPYGMRKWLIEGNHFHSMTTAIVTTGANAHHFRGALIANNILDIGRRLFIGGIINSTFSGNVVENGTRGSIISVTSGGSNLTFTGNVLGEAEPSDRELLHCIEFGPGAAGRNITITGNSFNWVDRSPVYFAGAATDVTISANSFDNWNLVAEVRWGAIRIEGAAKGLSVMGNAFGANPATTAPPVRVIGEVSGSTLVGNTFVNNAGVLYAGTVGDRNYIDRRSAGANQHELTAVKNGALVVRATGAPGVGADAFGSFVAASEQPTGAGPGVKGGVRVVPTNTSGSAAVEFLCSTNSSNGVAAMRVDVNGLVPTADNARDIGSAQNRVRTIHAHNLQLATVAVADLPAPAAGAIVMVKDPATGTATPAISDGKSWHRMSLGAAIK